ncbi:hypothetical protein [Tautonia rosea]|uniref:hypothetical protein n=1 Tax=Tautonia rosea TaxID=2728037 RepID=UPI0014746020|nr:hypothetical protein [Tautonia rosea]
MTQNYSGFGIRAGYAQIIAFLAMAAITHLTIPTAQAGLDPAPFSGSRSTADLQVFATDPNASAGWDSSHGGFKITWEIVAVNSTTLKYTYTITNQTGGNLGKALSNIIIQVTSPDEALAAGTTGFTYDNASTTNVGSVEVGTFVGGGGSTPGLPGTLYGIKFNTTGDPAQFTFSFETTKVPVWGSFYAKDGKSDQLEIYAMNQGLYGTDGTNGSSRPGSGDDVRLWIATPNGENFTPGPLPIPEPSSLALAIGCIAPLATIGVIRRRRQLKADAA